MTESLTPWMLRYAYENGAFPMGDESGEIQWFQPYRRALFPIEGIHVSHSLAKVLRRGDFVIRFDSEFERVMRSCLRPDENWITEELIRVYTQCHFEGWAHCCECWNRDELVGGIYGLAIGKCFSAESMFHRETNASKVALFHMVEKCQALGFSIFDAQIQNPHLKSLGAFEVPQRTYMIQLQSALKETTVWSCPRIEDELK